MSYTRNIGPEYNLIDEPWLPLTPLGETRPRLVGLREALRNATWYSGLAEGNPIIKASLLRFLTSMAYLVLDEASGGADARKLVRRSFSKASGFGDSDIDAVLERFEDRLWLFHPDFPFCQDPRLANDTSMKHPLGPLAITPYLPGDSGSRWGVSLSDAESVALDETARLLLANWFYTPSGNSAVRSDKASGGKSKRVASAAGANFPSLTNVFRAGASLFETIAANLLWTHQVLGNAEAVPAFLRVTELKTAMETLAPLYGATLSAATALVVESEPGTARLGENFLRGSTIIDESYENVANRFTALPLSEDPHALYLNNPNNKANHPRQNVSGSLAALPRFCLDIAKQFASGEIQKSGVFGVSSTMLGPSTPAELVFLQITQGGTGPGRTIEGAEELRVLGASVSPHAGLDDGAVAEERNLGVAECLEPLLAPSKSALSYLRAAVRHAIGPASRSLPDALSNAVRDDFYAAVGASVNRAVEDLTQDLATADRRRESRQEWTTSVLEVFDRHAGPYRFSQSSADRFWRARSSLQSNLRKVLV